MNDKAVEPGRVHLAPRKQWLRWPVPEGVVTTVVLAAVVWLWPARSGSGLTPDEQRLVGRWRSEVTLTRTDDYEFRSDRSVTATAAPYMTGGRPTTWRWKIVGGTLFLTELPPPGARVGQIVALYRKSADELSVAWDGDEQVTLMPTSPSGARDRVLTRIPDAGPP